MPSMIFKKIGRLRQVLIFIFYMLIHKLFSMFTHSLEGTTFLKHENSLTS